MQFVKDAVSGDLPPPKDESETLPSGNRFQSPTASIQPPTGNRFQSPTANIVSRPSTEQKSSMKKPDIYAGGRPPMPADKRIYPAQSQSLREQSGKIDQSTRPTSQKEDSIDQSATTEQQGPKGLGNLGRRRKL